MCYSQGQSTQQGPPLHPKMAGQHKFLKPFSTRRLEITVEAGCLLWGVRVIIPAPLQSQLLKELHHGHPGISKMKATARHHMWWPHLDQDIEKLVKNCQVCKAVKPGPPTAPLHPWSWPAKRVHIDFAGPIHGKSFLLAVDSHSKWPEVFQMAQTTATHTIEVLRHCKIRSSTTAGLRQWITISFRRISSVCQRKRNSSHILCPVPPLFKWTRGTSRAYIQAISADKCKGRLLS